VTTGAEAAATETGTATTAATVTPTDDDVGKEVVNTHGDELGMVVDVESNQMYVDPHASLTDKIRTALGWSDHDEDSYRVDNESIVRIEDDQVVLNVERSR
jgi:sporulation protein YlmC with PRC-barrel domain